MKKKFAALSAGLLTAALALSGCSNAADSGSSSPSESAAASEAAAADTDAVTLYVVRHGKTMLNTTDRVQGWADAPLTPAGVEVVEAAGRGLADVEFQSAYSSTSGRAYETADLILKESEKSSDLTIIQDERLREFNFGTYEGDLNHTMWQHIADDKGVTLEEFLANVDPKEFADTVAKLDKARPEAEGNWPAEDYDTIVARLDAGIKDIVEAETAKGDGNVLIVSHGLSIMAMLKHLFGDDMPEASGVKNASVTIIEYKDGEFELKSFNDESYIEKGQKK
ncbi:MAG: histidine phosphatase family protein [Ancrocorticia sp.]